MPRPNSRRFHHEHSRNYNNSSNNYEANMRYSYNNLYSPMENRLASAGDSSLSRTANLSSSAPSLTSMQRSSPTIATNRQIRQPSMDLQLRTLKVSGFHKDVTKDLLKELFIQVGPVKNVVLRPDHAFIEFADEESVGYALAAMSNVTLFNVPLNLEPKVASPEVFKYLDHLNSYIANPYLYLQF